MEAGLRAASWDDAGTIVLGWLTKVALVLGVLGLLAFDGISLLRTDFSAADQATTAASAAADAYKSSHDVQVSYDAALAAVAGNGDTIETGSFAVGPAGSVTLVLHSTATTLWIKDVGPLRGWTDISATGEGTPAQ